MNNVLGMKIFPPAIVETSGIKRDGKGGVKSQNPSSNISQLHCNLNRNRIKGTMDT